MEKPLQCWPATAYSWTYLRRDVVAGLTVATVAVPQAMAYALIAGLPPQYGLYTAIVLTALASIFGSSRFLINGPTNAISLVVFGAVAGLTTGPDDAERIQLVCLLALLAGFIQIAIAILKLGDLTRYVSEAVILGFMAGAGVLIGLSQVQPLFGLKPMGDSGDHVLQRLWLTCTQGGPINPMALVTGLVTLAVIFGLHRLNARLKVRLPELLITLVVISFLVWLLSLAAPRARFQGLEIDQPFPRFQLPTINQDRVQRLWGGALAVALLGLVEALAIAKALAARTGIPFDYNRQCLAEGLANLGAGMFQCMPGAGSLTRSSINYFAGAATRISGLFSALAVMGILLAFAPLAQYIPRPALAGVLVWTAWRIVDRQRLRFCLRATRYDAGLAIVTAFAAIFLSIEFSILVGTFLSFMFFVPRAAKLLGTELVVSPERVVRERQPGDPRCSKLVVFDLEGELFFGAAPELDAYLADLLRRVDEGARVVVLRLKRARNPDMVCLEHLQRFVREMKRRQATLLLCGVRPALAETLAKLRFHHWLSPECVFLEDSAAGSSTLSAVRRAYELLGPDVCATCPRRRELEKKGDWYYMI
jgi:SulP family sulfate permease